MPKSNWLVVLGTALAVIVFIVLPVAAIGALTADDAAPGESYIEDSAPDASVAGTTQQEMTRQRMQIHAETGPPEDFEPLQQRLHTQLRQSAQGQGLGNGRGPGEGTGYGNGGRGMGFGQEPGWLVDVDD